MTTRRDPFKGFTIVELLVVITIISVLVALLLPSLGSARTAALRTTCLSKVRQFGNAVGNYAIDNKNTYWPTYHTQSNLYFPQSYNDSATDYHGWPVLFKAYGLPEGSLQCPQKSYWFSVTFNSDWGPVHYGSYIYVANPEVGYGGTDANWWESDAFFKAIPTRIDSATAASFIVGDSVYTFPWGDFNPEATPHLINGALEGANQYFGDGHGVWKPRSAFPDTLQNTGPNRNCQYVFQPGSNNSALFW